MNPVIHFEMPYDDSARMARFYEAAFGWQMQTLGADMGHYVTAITGETDAGGAARPGSINGGFYALKTAVSFTDTEHNRVVMLQPQPRVGQTQP